MRFKPTWMERKLYEGNKNASTVNLDYNWGPHPLEKSKGLTKSVFEVGSYRHNLSTKEQLANDRSDYLRAASNFSSSRPAAGVIKNLRDVVLPRSSSFLKLDDPTQQMSNGTLRHSLSQSNRVINIKPYSVHNNSAYE